MRLALVLLAACRVNFDEHAPVADAAIDAISDRYYAAVMADHPAAYWRFADATPTAHDELGARDGTYSGTYQLGAAGALVGNSNTAAHFDGLTAEVLAPNGLELSGTQPFTLEVWVKEPLTQTYYHYVTSEPRIAGTPQNGYALYQGAVGIEFERIASPTKQEQTGQVTIAPNTWTHVVGVYDGTTVHLYLDGVEQATAPAPDTMASYTAPIFLGAHVEGANFGGVLDEAAIYDTALSVARIQAHHAIGIGQ